jgi:hypothetical protein
VDFNPAQNIGDSLFMKTFRLAHLVRQSIELGKFALQVLNRFRLQCLVQLLSSFRANSGDGGELQDDRRYLLPQLFVEVELSCLDQFNHFVD